jgi:thymidylate synthase (FAD)
LKSNISGNNRDNTMKVTLEEYTNPLNLGKYAGICYGKDGNDEKRLKHIIDVGHLSCLRFGMAVFKIEGISRVCLAQLTRSVHLSYLVRSSRYCDESDALMLIPESLRLHEKTVGNYLTLSKEVYKQLREAGVSKQDARYILPQAQETELYVSGNYQAWVDFIKLRSSKSAQTEVRAVALAIQKELQQVAPIIFGEPQ